MCEKNEQTLPVTIRIIDGAKKHRERLEFPTIDFSPCCTLSLLVTHSEQQLNVIALMYAL